MKGSEREVGEKKNGRELGVGEGGKEIYEIVGKKERETGWRLVDEGGNSRATAGTELVPKGVGKFCN